MLGGWRDARRADARPLWPDSKSHTLAGEVVITCPPSLDAFLAARLGFVALDLAVPVRVEVGVRLAKSGKVSYETRCKSQTQ